MASIDINLFTPQDQPAEGTADDDDDDDDKDGVPATSGSEAIEHRDHELNDEDRLGAMAHVVPPSIAEIGIARHDSGTARASSLKPLTAIATPTRC